MTKAKKATTDEKATVTGEDYDAWRRSRRRMRRATLTGAGLPVLGTRSASRVAWLILHGPTDSGLLHQLVPVEALWLDNGVVTPLMAGTVPGSMRSVTGENRLLREQGGWEAEVFQLVAEDTLGGVYCPTCGRHGNAEEWYDLRESGYGYDPTSVPAWVGEMRASEAERQRSE